LSETAIMAPQNSCPFVARKKISRGPEDKGFKIMREML
jgi:hypothetical protein